MNNRIKLLAEQSGFNPVNYMGSNLILFEKFAELIIRDCAAAANTKRTVVLRASETHSISYNEGLDAGISAFQKHFGVDEK